MKKILLLVIIIFSTMIASAQFIVQMGIEKDSNDEWSAESFTNNLGFGYMVTDKIMGGLTMSDATVDSEEVEGEDNVVQIASEMQLFGRYYHTENLFAQIITPLGSDVKDVSATDLIRLGAGYSFNVWNALNVEASYSMLIQANVNKDREGDFNFGLSYTF